MKILMSFILASIILSQCDAVRVLTECFERASKLNLVLEQAKERIR